RQLLKTPDYPQAILIRLEELHFPVTFIKIPRAENLADLPAKEARTTPATPTVGIRPFHCPFPNHVLQHQASPIAMYPNQLITQTYQRQIQKQTN
ncbi:MAG: hypothetical protein SGCHY_003010, partial [Lobulomycetales sp.]